MYKTTGEAKELAGALVKQLRACPNKLMIAPPFTALQSVAEIVKGTNILLGAQNMSSHEEGAFTGDISVKMLKDVGVAVVILGHSERRSIFGETDELINQKVKLALVNGLEAILCVGETLQEREAGKAEAIVVAQVERGLKGVSSSDIGRLTIAYEPVWAIGTGKNATPQDADAIHAVIRKTIAQLYSDGVAEAMTIQYGGSVKPGNIKELMQMENIDGALVGGASLQPDTFVPIADFK